MQKFLKAFFSDRLIRYTEHRNDAPGALYRAWSYVFASQMRGDYYEFGVHQGASLIHSYKLFSYWHKRYKSQRDAPQAESVRKNYWDYQPTFYAFDTFAGMPTNSEGGIVHAGSFQTSLDLVVNKCTKAGLVGSQLQIKQGLFANFFNEYQSKKETPASIVHIDGDLYASAVDALHIAKQVFQQGTVVLFDDYNLFNASNRAGERRALHEFLEQQSSFEFEPWFAYGPASQAFFCHVKE